MVMGKPPALIFVVRHGARLDAADKEWHLTSPTPYDPPLTYGGWTQCRALGARIASILLAREAAYLEEENASSRKRKKHRIILHSSPFLRCTQTSIAIAAGMSQFHGMQNEIRSQQQEPQTKTTSRTRNHSRHSSGLETIQDEDHDLDVLQKLPIKPFPKMRLRIDAFLGEWFSPEYYEHITHPPDSILMLAGAKAELLHRIEHVEGLSPGLEVPQPKFFPGGWGSPAVQPGTPSGDHKEGILQLPDVNGIDISRSPTRHRSTTLSSPLDTRKTATAVSKSGIGGYTQPTPRYAILATDPIPRGYTAHAREACVDADYAWDSTRPPQNWGDGGEYGEEWSSMHKRFRSGISRMIGWYSLHHESPYQSHGHLRSLHPIHDEDTDEDCEVDTVLILVTHGAGCNALIGALTDQPVLMDIPMASLTMATRKDSVPGHSDHASSPVSAGSPASRFFAHSELEMSQRYSVEIKASVSHLRSGDNPLSIPILQDPGLAYKIPFADRKTAPRSGPYMPQPRYKLNKSTMIKESPIDSITPLSPRSGPRYNGIQRSASAASRTGLWNMPSVKPVATQAATSGTKDSKEDQPTPDESATAPFDEPGRSDSIADQSATASDNTKPATLTPGLWPAPATGNLVNSSPGLWSTRKNSTIPSGPPSNLPLEVKEWSAATKRRWTFNENRAE